MGNPDPFAEGNPTGDWNVSIDDEFPDHIKFQFVEWDGEGATEKVLYMCPCGAQEFADAIMLKVKELMGDEE